MSSSHPEPIFRSRKRQTKPNVSIKLYVDIIKLLTRLKPMLKGYKTYIVGTLTALGAIAGYLVGDASLADAIQLAVTAVLSMTVRNGITK